MRTTLVLTALILLCSGISAQESIYDIIKTDSCPWMKVLGEQELYVGDELFNLINGGAELYHEFGFVKVLAAQTAIYGTDSLEVEIYDMGSPEAAWGIYSMTTTSSAKPLYAGVAGRRGDGFAQFIKGNYMVYIYFENAVDSSIQYVTGCINQKIENSFPPPEIMKAVQSGQEGAKKVIYFKGNLGLSSIYNFHYKDVFGYLDGAAAIFPDLKVFLLRYNDEGDCIEKYSTARDFFMNSSKYHEQIALRGSFHMKDRKEQQIDCYYENKYLLLFISSGEDELNEVREEIVNNMQ